MKVLCFGSLNIDYTYSVDHFVTKGETLSSDGLQVFTGGKGLNQSIALARAGAKVCHAGAAGPDGRFLLEAMENAGVDTGYVSVLNGARTGNAVIQRDKAGDNCILLYGGTNQMITKEQADTVLSDFSSGDYCVLQNEISEMPYIMEKAHERGMVIVLNPSPMNEKVFAMPLEYVDIFMLNEVEAAMITGLGDAGAAGAEKAADELVRRFPKAAVVLTLGGAGSIYAEAGSKFRQDVFKVDVADTTAAGDTFTGFFIGGILRGETRREAMREASAAAAVACSRKGAAPSIPTYDEVLEFLENYGK